jgi:hypothetical protein
MIRHLTSDEISNLLIGNATPEQQEHAAACTHCTESLEHLNETFLVFRESVHQWSGKNERAIPKSIDFHQNAAGFRLLRLRWALASAVLIILFVIPVLKNKREEQRARQAMEDALLLEQVNASLSRDVPASMEPLMNLVSEGNRQ